MRYFLSLGAFLFVLSGTGALALADPAVTATQAQSAATVTAPDAQTAPSNDDPGTPVNSPDVAQWTAQLVKEQQAASVHHTTPARAISRFASRILARTSLIARNLTRDALRFLGTPYVFGGTGASGFDCSGYVQHVFAMLGVSIPRTADAQYFAGKGVKGHIKAGDLVFFQTYEPGPSHVGIYIGNGKFVHASSSRGVMVSSLSDSYWSTRYLGAKRLLARR